MKKNFFLSLCAAVMGLSGCIKLDKSSGCLNGSFSVAEGKYVRFSRGNLQYTWSTQTWSFAKNQYDIIGTDNVTGGTVELSAKNGNGDSKIGRASADKIDLFSWSGSTGVAKWGLSFLDYYGDFLDDDGNYYGGDFVDWGQNAIRNGGNKANQWRTLTADEWEYLINDRPNASSLLGVASVNGVNGLVLLPDGWKQPNGVSFKSGFASKCGGVASYGDCQTFTLYRWNKLEKSGAVFLPASGVRLGLFVSYVGCSSNYRSATSNDEYTACHLIFFPTEAKMIDYTRSGGLAVRLVQDVK